MPSRSDWRSCDRSAKLGHEPTKPFRQAHPVCVESLAALLGASPDWLRHACAKAGAEPPLRLLTRARLARAQALIAHTGLTLSEVARQSGYRDDRYLVAVFRRELGCTPGQLRAGRPRG